MFTLSVIAAVVLVLWLMAMTYLYGEAISYSGKRPTFWQMSLLGIMLGVLPIVLIINALDHLWGLGPRALLEKEYNGEW